MCLIHYLAEMVEQQRNQTGHRGVQEVRHRKSPRDHGRSGQGMHSRNCQLIANPQPRDTEPSLQPVPGPALHQRAQWIRTRCSSTQVLCPYPLGFET
mgnify:CR=1 FL=1